MQTFNELNIACIIHSGIVLTMLRNTTSMIILVKLKMNLKM